MATLALTLIVNGNLSLLEDITMDCNIDAVLKFAEQHEFVKTSLEIIKKCLESYDYDLKRFALSFNGGKDCTVLLHLMYTVLVSSNRFSEKDHLMTLYFETFDNFHEIDEFIKQSVSRYRLELMSMPFDGDWKNVLTKLKNADQGKTIDAIFLGTRETDINYSLKPVQRTDCDWPDFLRVNPILHWTYHEVWTFLRQLNVPYCNLYDRGYTSIGSRSTTSVNPLLKTVTAEGNVTYLPAYRLDDPNAERSGRSK